MISVLFNTLFAFIPLIFFKNTSELFEFNKIVVVYIFTILITTFWIIKSIKSGKFIFRRTILDIPIVLFLLALLISTLFSIEPRTSWFGYYSRFNGGLISQICYALLYWAFVSNLNNLQAIRSIHYLLFSTTIAGTLAILEHFGIFTTCKLMGFELNKSCWIQDVKTRVFSTLGQPNWLAALTVTLIPITWSQILNSKKTSLIVNIILSLIFFTTLIFTGSRSGLLAFAIEFVLFWGFVFYKKKLQHLREFLLISIIFTSFYLYFSQPFKRARQPTPINLGGPALETGGTESGTIRKYVWLGAVEIFKNYPILGTGPETFAYIFPSFKPSEHNLTSEWDFVYNKAHNEFLNYLANTGMFGFLAYLALIFFSIKQIFKIRLTNMGLAFLNGYLGILITNFFGFSVVVTSLLFFLLPAIAAAYNIQDEGKTLKNKNNNNFFQNAATCVVLFTASFLIYAAYSYWKADYYYNLARNYNLSDANQKALEKIDKAIKIAPSEAIYVAEKAVANNQVETALEALNLNPYNQNIRNILISILIKNSSQSSNYLLMAEDAAKTGTILTAKNPKIFYQLALLNFKNVKVQEGLQNLDKAISLKPNYKEAHFAKGLALIELKRNMEAAASFQHIIDKIDPNDELAKKYLQEAILSIK